MTNAKTRRYNVYFNIRTKNFDCCYLMIVRTHLSRLKFSLAHWRNRKHTELLRRGKLRIFRIHNIFCVDISAQAQSTGKLKRVA